MSRSINYLFLLIPLFFVLSSSAQTEFIEINDSLFSNYSYEEFLAQDILQEKVIGGNIDYELLNATIFHLTNKIRDEHNLALLSFSEQLYRSANDHSKDMVEYHFYSHTSVVEGKETLRERLSLVGLTTGYFSENIASNSVSFTTYLQLAENIVTGWMNSPPHRENILNEDLRFLGCGTYNYDPNNRKQINVFSTQNFATEIINDSE